MSSTSSSECDCENYRPNFKNSNLTSYANIYGSNHPFYPTMGRPLVYYSQVPQARKLTHQDRRRGSPNCFVKAFKWYTKDVPFRKVPPPKRDMSSFAAWLDVKYDQFLEESQMGSDKYHIRLSQTFEAERASDQNNNINCEPCATKKFRRRRPWKRRIYTKNNNVGLERQKSNHSCKYIMQPTDNLSRSASVCCHPSNSTTAVSDSKNKTMRKSQSDSNVTMVIKNKQPDEAKPGQDNIGDESCHDTNCLASNRQTAGKYQQSQPQSNLSKKAVVKESCYTNRGNMCPKKTDSKSSLTERSKISTVNKTVLSQDFECQCDQEMAAKVNAGTQYDVVVPPISRHGSVPSNSYQSERFNQCECPGHEKKIQRPTSKVAQNTSKTPCRSGTAECQCKSVDTMTVRHVKAKKIHKKLSETHRDVECQCPEKKVVAVPVETQYSPPPPHEATGNYNNNTCECNFKKSVRRYETFKQSIPLLSRQCCSCEPKIKEKPVAEKITSGCVMYAQTTSQTSNHSICLEKEAVPEYPLFLKIVCADKLSSEHFK